MYRTPIHMHKNYFRSILYWQYLEQVVSLYIIIYSPIIDFKIAPHISIGQVSSSKIIVQYTISPYLDVIWFVSQYSTLYSYFQNFDILINSFTLIFFIPLSIPYTYLYTYFILYYLIIYHNYFPHLRNQKNLNYNFSVS